MLPLAAVFESLDDPRSARNRLHRLTDIPTLAVCAVLGGANTWDAIAKYGRAEEDFFRRFLPLDNGIPSHDTFLRVFAELDPAMAMFCFAAQVAQRVAVAIESQQATKVTAVNLLARPLGCGHSGELALDATTWNSP